MSAPRAPAGHFVLLYFASATSFTQKQYEFLPAPIRLNELHGLLEQKYPGIEQTVLSSCAITINLDYVVVEEEGERTVQSGDEVAIIPPVSSG